MRKYKYLEPEAKKAIECGKKENADVIMCVDGYVTDKESLILRDMLWYARDNGVVIQFVPQFKN